MRKGIKLHTDFLEKVNITSTKNQDIKINMNFVKSVREKQVKYKNSFDQSSKQNKILIKNEFEQEVKQKVVELKNNANVTQYSSNLASSVNDRRKSLVKSRESFLSNPQQPNSTASQRPKFPMSAAQALKHYMNEMNDHESAEILDYKTIYYLGLG